MTDREREARRKLLRERMEQWATAHEVRTYDPPQLAREVLALLDEVADLSDSLDLAQQEAPHVESNIIAERDSAWRAAIKGMRKQRGGRFKSADAAWNAALAALAERMGTDDPPRDAQPARLSGDPC